MRENRLTPFLDPRYKIDGSLEIPLERAKDQLEKHTRYWPMIISQTTIFNMQAVSVKLFFFWINDISFIDNIYQVKNKII